MSDIFLVAFVVVALISCLLAARLGLPRINPVSVLAFVWIPLLGIASIPGYIDPALSLRSQVLLTLGITSAMVGSLVGATLSRNACVPDRRRVSVDVLLQWHRRACALLVFHAAIQLYQVLPLIRDFGGFSQLFSFGGSSAGSFKIQLVRTLAETRAVGFSPTRALLGVANYASFLGFFSVFTGAILWRYGRRRIAVLPLFVAGGYSFLSLQRTTFAMVALLFAVSVVLLRKGLEGTTARRRHPLQTVALGAFGFVVLLVPLHLRNAGTGRSTGLRSLMEYLIASVGGFNARLVGGGGAVPPPTGVRGDVGPTMGFGSYTFTNFYAILARFGVHVQVPPFSYDFLPIVIGGHNFTSNTATSFYDYFLDFGWAGLVAFPFCIGWIAAACQVRVARGRILWVPLGAVTMVTLAWSFFVNALTRDVRFSFLVAFSTWALTRPKLFAEASVTRTSALQDAAVSTVLASTRP